MLEGGLQRREHEHRLAAWTAWTTAALGRAKKLPALDKVMPKAGKRKARRQDWKDQKMIAMTLNAMFGGEVKTRE